MRHLLSCLLVASTLLASAAARADGPSAWDATFAPPGLASHLPAGDLAIIVLPVGPASPALRAAADAFGAALRVSGRVPTVLDDASVGELGAVDDNTALERVRALPVSHVAIVRLVAGEPPRALISIYPKDGHEPVTSFIATSGVALAEVTAGRAGSGTRLAVEPEAAPPAPTADEVQDAKARYRREYIGADGFDIELFVTNNFASARVKTRFYQGERRTPLDGKAFYEAVGRQDLVAAYETRAETRTGLMVGGLVVGLAALIPAVGWEDCGLGADFGSCNSRNEDRIIWASVLASVGIGAITIGAVLDDDPVSDRTRRSLAAAHNAELRSGLHLETARARPSRGAGWNLVPALAPGYGGLNLALAF
jgi:hypothetical protein